MVHEALRLTRLAVLPPPIRGTALSAANGSLDDLLKLQSLMTGGSQEHSNAFLPAFYVNLQRASIPNPAHLENVLLPQEEVAILLAWVSLDSIYRMDNVPADSLIDLWPYLWKWVQFFHSNFDSLSWMTAEGGPSEELVCTDFLEFVGGFYKSESALELMLTTRGFRYIISRAWVFRIHDNDPDLDLGYPGLTHLLLTHRDGTTVESIREIIDGAGGTYDDLALLVVGYIRGILPARDDSAPFEVIYLLYNLVDFVTKVDDTMQGHPSARDDPLGPLGVALLSRGIVKGLTTMAYALSHVTASTGAITILGHTLTYLLRIFKAPRGHRLVAEALDAGLLYTVASCGVTGVMYYECICILQDLLPASLAYYYNVDAIDNAFHEVQELVHNEHFRRSAIVDQWRIFTALARERVLLLDSVRAGKFPSRRACDNVQCNKIRSKSAFRRCAGCQSFYYCSRQCQQIDWRQGGHREACSAGCPYHLGDGHRNPVSVRERLFMSIHPGETYFTLFDYRQGRVEITVQPLADIPVELGASAEWKNDVVRASNSRGQLELDVVALSDGTSTRYVIVPLRTNNPGTQGALARLASCSPRLKDIPQLVEGVRLSSEACSPNAVEIH
ncbi:hypothetical protein FB451DRAFT_1560047 [Mycena latifolia]|nr:hypothetical protein FB451DRAFT_1560047 [Mycena latifolia]